MCLKVILTIAIAKFSLAAAGRQDYCSLPPDPGPCTNKTSTRFAFDAAAGRCGYFSYGGCGGNDNSFDSVLECHEACDNGDGGPGNRRDPLLKHLKSPHCLKPAQAGPLRCAGFFPRFTFSRVTGTCRPVVYGGCGGTDNLYFTLEECLSSCLHQVAPPTAAATTTTSLPDLLVRGAFGPPPAAEDGGEEEGEEVKIIFPGFPTGEGDPCMLPPVEPGTSGCGGNSTAATKWTFSARQGGCVEQAYGGCRGTANLFDSRSQCLEECGRHLLPDACRQPPVRPGPESCSQRLERYSYRVDAGRCESFLYAGCRGTENLFLTEEECSEACRPGGPANSSGTKANFPPAKTEDVCSLPIEVGYCRARLERFAFDTITRRCQKVIYGGCGGNGNIFKSLEDCVNTCGGTTEPLEAPACDPSSCDLQVARWYQARACRPVVKPGECCPSSWDCSRWEERLRHRDRCFLANEEHPDGMYLDVGEDVRVPGNGCGREGGCTCFPPRDGGFASIGCILVKCAEPAACRGEGDALWQYDGAEDCCASDAKCGTELEELGTCTFEGREYRHGEKMTSVEDPCRQCLCSPGWDEASPGDSCFVKDCYAGHQEELLRGCQPVHDDRTCCPVDWLCPEDELDVVAPPTAAATTFLIIPGSDLSASRRVAVHPSAPRGTVGHPCHGAPKVIAGDKNTCRARVRFRYSPEMRACVTFRTNSCAVGPPGFGSLMECRRICDSHQAPPATPAPATSPPSLVQSPECSQPVNPGICLSRLRRWFFDGGLGSCQQFWYTGCLGNANNFDSLEECQDKCPGVALQPEAKAIEVSGTEAAPLCNLEPVEGLCRAIVPSWYFDPSTRTCRTFSYGGCGGNANRFKSPAGCSAACPVDPPAQAALAASCSLPRDAGRRCPDGAAPGDRYYHDAATGRCERFEHAGCGGNDNSFESHTACSLACRAGGYEEAAKLAAAAPTPPQEQQQPVARSPRSLPSPACLEEKRIGPCRAALRRFYYDREDGGCKDFLYGGCRGNGNNFPSLPACQAACGPPSGVSPADSPRRRTAPRTLADDGAAEEGAGNEVGDIENDVCSMALDSGGCLAYRPMWFFDASEQKCRRFFWGGCGGNANRFDTREACQTRCSSLGGPPPNAPEGPKCALGGRTFDLGEAARPGRDGCVRCTCDTPPSLTCRVKACPARHQVQNGANCTVAYDEDGCCVASVSCGPAASASSSVEQ